jgi:hypothetical protein
MPLETLAQKISEIYRCDPQQVHFHQGEYLNPDRQKEYIDSTGIPGEDLSRPIMRYVTGGILYKYSYAAGVLFMHEKLGEEPVLLARKFTIGKRIRD